MKVLFAEPEKYIQKFYVEMTQGSSFDVQTVKDGIKAFDTIVDGGISVLITEYDMWGMNGVELLKAIRGIGSEIPIIMVSSYLNETLVEEECNALGFSALLKKPFHVEKLMNAIESALMVASG